MPPPDVVKNRWLSFLICMSIASIGGRLLPSLLFRPPPFSFPLDVLSFLLSLLLSVLLFSLALFLLASPHPELSASPPELATVLLKISLKSVIGGFTEPSLSSDSRRRARRSLSSFLFVVICAVSGFFSMTSIWMGAGVLDGPRLIRLGMRGLVFGLVYGFHFVHRRRWILRFPIIQRPLFYSLKMGIVSSTKQALKLSTAVLFCSTLLMAFLPDQSKRETTTSELIIEQIMSYVGTSAISHYFEISRHLLEVVHTMRFSFTPPQGSAAAETNPSEMLIDALEQSSSRSLIQYLAYLDLCMVVESNVEPWRRAAFFEETGETYRRVVYACLRPLEQLTSRLAEGLERFSVDKSLLSHQLNSPIDAQVDPMLLHEAFNDFQLCQWCARTVGALTARSNWEDRYRVAQLTGCNKAVVSTLLSCLLAVEACMGRKTNPQPAHLMGPAGIRWATSKTPRRDVFVVSTKVMRPGGPLHQKAYVMADSLRTSIYQIVSIFQADMQANAKASVLEKNWIADGTPLYGTHEALLKKLGLFLEFRAV